MDVVSTAESPRAPEHHEGERDMREDDHWTKLEYIEGLEVNRDR